LTLIMNVRAPFCTLSRTRSIINIMISAFASPASVVRGPLPIHLDISLVSHLMSCGDGAPQTTHDIWEV
jgi:hypothetical protein